MVVIESLLPNPVGPDRGAEWIGLTNRGTDAANLTGWLLKDASGKTFILSGTLAPQENVKLKDSQTKIVLNNDTDMVYLYDRSGKLVDKLSYENPAEGEVITRGDTSASVGGAIPANVATDPGRIAQQAQLDVAPVIVGLLLAVAMGVLTAYVAKYLGAENESGKF